MRNSLAKWAIERGSRAVTAYREKRDILKEGPLPILVDLVTDLHYWAQSRGADLDLAVHMAKNHFDEESDETSWEPDSTMAVMTPEEVCKRIVSGYYTASKSARDAAKDALTS